MMRLLAVAVLAGAAHGLAPLRSPASLVSPALRHHHRRRVAVSPRLEVQPSQAALPSFPELLRDNKELKEENKMLKAENVRLQATLDDMAKDIMNADVVARAARKSFLDNIAIFNLVIIVTFGMGVAYSLLGDDVRAVAALYYFDLGPDVYPGFARATVALDLFLRLPGDLLHQYEALVPTNPVFYKACTSGVAYAFGDFVSQIYQGRNLNSLDLPRSFRSGAAGFIGHGPLCHYWMLTMEQYLDFGGAWWATGFKVLADQTVWSLYLNAMYSFLIGTLAFRNPGDVWKDVKATSWPALRSSWRFWPFVHCISFSHAVPIDLKLLWVDVMEIVWVTILSRVANQDDSAEGAETAVVSYEFGVDPTLEIALSQQVMQGTLLFSTIDGWKCSDDGSCYVLDEGADQKEQAGLFDGFELPSAKEVFENSWPLAVMWPVLFLFYQGELLLGLDV